MKVWKAESLLIRDDFKIKWDWACTRDAHTRGSSSALTHRTRGWLTFTPKLAPLWSSCVWEKGFIHPKALALPMTHVFLSLSSPSLSASPKGCFSKLIPNLTNLPLTSWAVLLPVTLLQSLVPHLLYICIPSPYCNSYVALRCSDFFLSLVFLFSSLFLSVSATKMQDLLFNC
jgi:hypothetical protein